MKEQIENEDGVMNERGISDYVRDRLNDLGIKLTPDESLAVVGLMCEAILLGLLRDGKVSIPTFGIFQAKQRGVAVNFRSTTPIKMMCLSFRPSRRLLAIFRKLLDQKLDFSKLGERWWHVKEESGIRSET